MLIATHKSDAATSDEDIMFQISRLFLLVPKSQDENELKSVFEVRLLCLSRQADVYDCCSAGVYTPSYNDLSSFTTRWMCGVSYKNVSNRKIWDSTQL